MDGKLIYCEECKKPIKNITRHNSRERCSRIKYLRAKRKKWLE